MLSHLPKLITTLKNAKKAQLKKIKIFQPISLQTYRLLKILYNEGYINGFNLKFDKHKNFYFVVYLKYYRDGKSVINNIVQISKSSRRCYASIKVLWKVKKGLGIFVLSTPQGLMTDRDARLNNLGGEVLLAIM